MRLSPLAAFIFLITFLQSQLAHAETLAIVHGTLIDVSNFGRTANDIAASVIIVKDGKIEAAGPAKKVKVPQGAHVIDAQDGYIVPGLIDGFGDMRTQGFANAYLYEGVTTVYVREAGANGDGDLANKIFSTASPSPRQFRGAVMTGYSATGEDVAIQPMTDHRLHDPRLSNEALEARIALLAAKGYRGVTISYDTWPDQVDVIVRAARAHQMATLGELAFASYPYAVRAGVSALAHNDRYQTALATSGHLLDYSDGPLSMSARDAYMDVCAADPLSAAVSDYGILLAKSDTALLPILSIEATADSLDVPNPWSSPVAKLIAPADLDDPADQTTGESAFLAKAKPERRASLQECARHRQLIDRRLHELGARYLAGSGSPGFGLMPGSGLHEELALLVRVGLTPREALAAATSNFADVYGWTDVGRIEPGRNADMLILRSDPRANVSALDDIGTMIVDGKIVDRAALLK